MSVARALSLVFNLWSLLRPHLLHLLPLPLHPAALTLHTPNFSPSQHTPSRSATDLLDVGLGDGELLASGNLDHELHEVEARDQLRHRVLDLSRAQMSHAELGAAAEREEERDEEEEGEMKGERRGEEG